MAINSFLSGSPYGGMAGTVFGSEGFPSPFLDMASLSMPEHMRSALDWSEFIFYSHGTYRRAMERLFSYFLTRIEVSSPHGQDPISDDERDKYETYLNEDLDALQNTQDMLRHRGCYGNAFASMVVPFKRILYCKGRVGDHACGSQFPLSEVMTKDQFRWSFENMEFTATCPKCGWRGEWGLNDLPIKDQAKIRIKIWNPKEIEILQDPWTGQCRYMWRIPQDYRRDIMKGSLWHLENAPKEVIEAVKKNWIYKFKPDALFHMREPTLAGTKTRGWGIPQTLINFRQIWYVQVLRRQNEAIALDYVTPFRLITPEARSGSGAGGGQYIDPLLSVNMGDFTGAVRSMLRRRRQDPAGWHTLPYPVQYQALGGDANAFAPKDLMDQGLETLLNETGVPVELYKGSLTLQTAPVALRLFEASWHHLVHDINAFLNWIVKQLCEILSWESVACKMKRVTYTDDMNRQMALLQLMMGQTISQTTGLGGLDIRYKDEVKRKAEEARFEAEEQAEVQEEMQQSATGQAIAKGQGGGQPQPGQQGQPGQPQQGGDPSQGGQPMQQPGPVTNMLQSGSTPQTPDQMMEQASQIATDLLGLPSSQRLSELKALREKNETMHSLVKAQMQKTRSKARSAGGSQVMTQSFGTS